MVAAKQSEKIHENRLRRMAERQGLRLVKSRRRDPRALDFGTYTIEDPGMDIVGQRSRRSLPLQPFFSLDDVERYLTGEGGED